MLIQPQAMEGEGSGQPSKPQHTPTTTSPSNIEPIPIIASSPHLKKTHKRWKTKRKATEISQSSGPTTLVVDETVHEERGDSMEKAATIAASLDAKQDSGSGPRCQDTILGDRPAQTRFERLSKQSNDPPLLRVNTLGNLEIINLKKRVKKLEKKKKARTSQLKRMLIKVRIESSANKSLGDQEDASKQGRNIVESDQDEGISFVQEDAETQGRYDHDIDVTSASTPITTAGVSVTLMKMRSEKSKEKSKDKSKEKGVSSKTATTTTRGVTIQEPSESGTRKTVSHQQHDPKDKGKAKMIKPEKPSKKKDQIKFDEEMAKRLADELEVELEEEERLAKQREEEANLIS
ncbi:hypothetical protein Tco_1359992 [Tanacetum coccineum]